MAALTAPRHRDLARAMAAELDSIADPAERRRFAVGAVAAIVRLALGRCWERTFRAPGRSVGVPDPDDTVNAGDPSMPEFPTRQLLRRHVVPFTVAFTLLTALMLNNFAARVTPQLSGRGEPVGTLLEALLLALPSTIALSIPMAVFLAVSWVFARLGREGVLAAAQAERHGVRRLVVPVLGAAALIAALMVVSNTEILPRANGRLTAVLVGHPVAQDERSMTTGELREAARTALTAAGPNAAVRALEYEVEIQKKFALAAACLVLALAGAAIALRFPRGGKRLVLAACVVVFVGYYLSLIAGETLADVQVISPFVAMWTGNALLLAGALLLAWRPGHPGTPRASETAPPVGDGSGGDTGLPRPGAASGPALRLVAVNP